MNNNTIRLLMGAGERQRATSLDSFRQPAYNPPHNCTPQRVDRDE